MFDAENSPTETRVSFRICAPELDIEDITQSLHLTPDMTHRRGEHPRGNSKYAPYKQAMWSVDSKLSPVEPLESHLLVLLSMLEPNQSYLQSLAQRTEMDFYSTIFNKNGVQLSPQTLKRITNLGAGLGVTVYPELSEADPDAS